MKRNLLLASMMLAAGSLIAADPKEDVTAAAKKLADAPSYGWKQTTDNAGGGGGGGGGFGGGRGGGPQEGVATKDGFVYRKITFGDNSIETLNKGTNGAMNGQDGWQTFADMAANGGGGGGGRRGGGFGAGQPTPAAQAQDIVKATKELKESGGIFVGDLSAEGAKTLLTPNFGGRRGGGGGGGGFTPPEVKDAKGSVKFWVKDGTLAKYELKLQGKMTFNDNDIDINRTTTVEINNVGTAKFNAPEDIKKKL